MYIKYGNYQTIDCELYKERAYYQGISRDAMRIETTQGLSSEEITALTSHDIIVYNDDGTEAGKYSGYNTLIGHRIVLGKITSEDAIRDERDALDAKLQKMVIALGGIKLAIQAIVARLPESDTTAALIEPIIAQIEKAMKG